MKLNKLANDKVQERYESSRAKKVEVFIQQQGILDLSKDKTHLMYGVSIVNKSDFAIKIDAVELSIVEAGRKLDIKLPDHYNYFHNLIIEAKDKYEKIYYIRVDKNKNTA